jgi:hypothetical protein
MALESRTVAKLFLVLLGLAFASPVQADEILYVLFFGSQSNPRRMKYTHTWATIVKATGEGKDLDKYRLEVNTCSWLPATLNVRVWRLRPETGVNLDLDSTIIAMLENDEEITEWGPYQIAETSYERGLGQILRLDNGEYKYRAIDGLSRASNIANCFHSISDLDRENSRRRYPLIGAGENVTFDIVQTMHRRNKIIAPETDHSWIDHRLGLDAYPITHRHFSEGPP